jgi:hypothetical protein
MNAALKKNPRMGLHVDMNTFKAKVLTFHTGHSGEELWSLCHSNRVAFIIFTESNIKV